MSCKKDWRVAAEIDDGMKLGANHPMGPLALADLVGLDTLLSVQQHLYEEFGDPKYRVPGTAKEDGAGRSFGPQVRQGVLRLQLIRTLS